MQGFYKSLGVSSKGMASIIGRAKRLRREGFPMDGFKELKVAETASAPAGSFGPCQGIEMSWENGRIIRFQQVDELVDFLKKVA